MPQHMSTTTEFEELRSSNKPCRIVDSREFQYLPVLEYICNRFPQLNLTEKPTKIYQNFRRSFLLASTRVVEHVMVKDRERVRSDPLKDDDKNILKNINIKNIF